MLKLVLIGFLGLFISGAVAADEIDDLYMQKITRFLKEKPAVKVRQPGSKAYVDAWERINGLSLMVEIHDEKRLSNSMLIQLNKRITSLRRINLIELNQDDETLKAMVRLYANFADGYLSGRIKYNDYATIADYVKGQGKRFAESVRGRAYDENKCRWSTPNCIAPKEVWEQSL